MLGTEAYFCGATQIGERIAHSLPHTNICAFLITGKVPVGSYSPLISGRPRKSIPNRPHNRTPTNGGSLDAAALRTPLAHRFLLGLV